MNEEWYNCVYVYTIICWNCKEETKIIHNILQAYEDNIFTKIVSSGNLDHTVMKDLAAQNDCVFGPNLENYFDPWATYCKECNMVQGTFYLNGYITKFVSNDEWQEEHLVYKKYLPERKSSFIV